MKQNATGFLSSDLPLAAWDDARIVVIPAPYERTVSYGGGTARGPQAILDASQQLEVFDGKGCPGEAGIFTSVPPPGMEGTEEQALDGIGAAMAKAVGDGKRPLLLGGEHTVTYGAVRALAASGVALGVVQFDAHADLRDTYQDNPLSHACVMRRIHELGVPIFQVGVRSLSQAEHVYRTTHRVPHLDAEAIHARPLPVPLLPAAFPEMVYLTFDVDAFDASLMPATGTPEPGGLFWHQAVHLVRRSLDGRSLLAADVVELAPQSGLHACDFTAAKMAYTLMGA